jgi:chromosome transmission fidelity protein 8
MPTIPLHLSSGIPVPKVSNPLPPILQTPYGLALVELQGTINMPSNSSSDPDQSSGTPIGRLVFPAESSDPENKEWMKRVYLYVGKHQRMTGEVKKLVNPLAVVQKRQGTGLDEELEIVEILRWKILFGSRPEPVGDDVVMEDLGEEVEG